MPMAMIIYHIDVGVGKCNNRQIKRDYLEEFILQEI